MGLGELLICGSIALMAITVSVSVLILLIKS